MTQGAIGNELWTIAETVTDYYSHDWSKLMGLLEALFKLELTLYEYNIWRGWERDCIGLYSRLAASLH
jgi:hypothetical protein